MGSTVYLVGPFTITSVEATPTGLETLADMQGFPLISSVAVTVAVFVPYLTAPLNVSGNVPTLALSP